MLVANPASIWIDEHDRLHKVEAFKLKSEKTQVTQTASGQVNVTAAKSIDELLDKTGGRRRR